MNVRYRIVFFKFCLFLVFVFSSVCNEEDEIEITLISPIVSEGVRTDKVALEGLINDLSVEELKVVVNDQPIQFVQVKKGYFQGTLNLDERENHVVLYGATFERKYFRFEARIINYSRKVKTLEQRIAPKLSLNHLNPEEFKVLSPAQYETMTVQLTDNGEKILQLGYVLDNGAPVYLDPDLKKPVALRLPNPSGKSSTLEVFAMDGDKNKVIQKYHFRLEQLECSVRIGPRYGIFERTPVSMKVRVKGGKAPLEYFYRLRSAAGGFIEKQSSRKTENISLRGKFDSAVRLKGEVLVRDSQGIDAICRARDTLSFYPQEHPRLFQLSKRTKLESTKQSLLFSIEPPVMGGEMTILLKWNDPFHGVSGQEWKVLGRHKLQSNGYQRFWKFDLDKRVPVGNYLMKLSMVLGNDQLTFTETMPVEVTRAQDDTRDLLQEILAGEETD